LQRKQTFRATSLDLPLLVVFYPSGQQQKSGALTREDFMKVSIKEFDVAMDVKKKGIEFDVYEPGENGERLGDLRLTMSGLEWHNGRKHTGPKKSWKEFIAWMNEE
jgi:hypothetical protein